MYSSILTEKKKSTNPLVNLKIEIVKKLSSVFNTIFSPILKQATKAISRAVKIQLVFDAIILVGIASIIFLMLKILKNQNVQTESLVLTEAINFNSIAGTVTKILGTTAGFILLVDGILYNIAFYKGYFKDSLGTSVVGFSSIVKYLQDLITKEKKEAAGNNNILHRLFILEDQLDRLESNFETVIEKASSLKVKYSSSNAVVRFFKVYGAVIKELGWKRFFEILATPIILASMPLRIELPVAYENVKAKIAKYKEERKVGSKFTLELVNIGSAKRDLSDDIFLLNGEEEITDTKEKEKLDLSFGKDFPIKRAVFRSDYLIINKNKNKILIRILVENDRNLILYNVYIFKIDKLDMTGVEDIINTIKSYADKYKRRIMEETKTVSIIKSTLMKIYKIKGE